MSYTEDNVCKLLIMDATESDEAEYTCKAVNCEGEVQHSAELIVISTGVWGIRVYLPYTVSVH